MKTMMLAGKEIFITRSHHQVLEAWERSNGLNVFSIDYHTDTKKALSAYSYYRAESEVKSGGCKNLKQRSRELKEEKILQYLNKTISIKQINDNLRHDEHIDFAVCTDMVDMVFVMTKNKNLSSSNPNVYRVDSRETYDKQRILEYSAVSDFDEKCFNQFGNPSIEDEILQKGIARAESFRASFFDQYILDIDCDYFNSEESLFPRSLEVFKKLIKESQMITIALEPECVKICRHKNSSLTSDIILDRLLSIIEES